MLDALSNTMQETLGGEAEGAFSFDPVIDHPLIGRHGSKHHADFTVWADANTVYAVLPASASTHTVILHGVIMCTRHQQSHLLLGTAL